MPKGRRKILKTIVKVHRLDEIIHAKFVWYEKNFKTKSFAYGKGQRTKIMAFQIHSRVYIFF